MMIHQDLQFLKEISAWICCPRTNLHGVDLQLVVLINSGDGSLEHLLKFKANTAGKTIMKQIKNFHIFTPVITLQFTRLKYNEFSFLIKCFSHKV